MFCGQVEEFIFCPDVGDAIEGHTGQEPRKLCDLWYSSLDKKMELELGALCHLVLIIEIIMSCHKNKWMLEQVEKFYCQEVPGERVASEEDREWPAGEVSPEHGSQALLLFIFWLLCAVCRVLIPQPGILAVKARRPNHWADREFLGPAPSDRCVPPWPLLSSHTHHILTQNQDTLKSVLLPWPMGLAYF